MTKNETLKAIAGKFSELSELVASLVTDEKPVEPEISLAEIRGKLAEYSQAGFTSEIRTIIGKFGAKKLSEINPSDYKAVLEMAEKLND